MISNLYVRICHILNSEVEFYYLNSLPSNRLLPRTFFASYNANNNITNAVTRFVDAVGVRERIVP